MIPSESGKYRPDEEPNPQIEQCYKENLNFEKVFFFIAGVVAKLFYIIHYPTLLRSFWASIQVITVAE